MQFETELNESGTYTPVAYASISRRFAALMIDVLVLIIPCAIAGSIIPVIGGALVWFLYGPILESSSIRATIGKHMMGIQVSDLKGGRLSLKVSAIRNVMKLVSGGMMLVGFVLAFFTQRKQTFHDIVADTVVTYGRSEESVVDSWVASVKATFQQAQEVSAPFMPERNQGSTLDKLERLQKLREQGALTDDEFQREKAKLL